MSSEDERESQVSDMDMGPIEPTAPHLEHFKCKYDQKWDYPAIANSMFDGEKVLVVAEKLSSNAHVHFQGITSLAPRTFGDRMTDLAKTHFLTTLQPGSRPVKRVRKEVTVTGFQYQMKEGNPPLYQRGFTEEELLELHKKSEDHVKKLKFNIKEEIWKIPGQYLKADPQVVFERTMLMIGLKLREEKKSKTRFTRLDVIDGLLHHPDAPDELVKHMMMLH